MRSPRPALLALMFTMTVAGREAEASWPNSPLNANVAVSAAALDQLSPRIVSDGAGGALVTWNDRRSGTSNIYAQRISASGLPQWSANGVAICTAANDQIVPKIVSDGAGGAIVVWQDARSGTNNDIYAQRVNLNGGLQWPTNGVALSTATGDQYAPEIISDGAGGAIVTWFDRRSGANYDIYAQRLSASGVPQWTVNGVALCAAANDQLIPTMASDGAGGAIVTWYDYRGGTTSDIYAQRISAGGVAEWTADGVALCTAASDQTQPRVATDGAGGAYVTWTDYRGGLTADIYIRRVSLNGSPGFTLNGEALCTATGNQSAPLIVEDGAGGAIVTWQDARSGSDDVYAQRFGVGGAGLWTANGVALCTAASNQQSPTLASDGAGGAIVTWHDDRTGSSDIYAQRISLTGLVQWTANGVALCTTTGNQRIPTIAADGAGGAIVTWPDYRGGATSDVYAQRIERFGRLGNPEPTITGVRDVPNDQGGFVKVSWNASYLDADPTFGIYDYRLWRSVPASLMRDGAALLRRGVTTDADEAARTGRLLVTQFNAQGYTWELVATQAPGPLPEYSLTAATTSDSVAGSNPYTAFMVQGRAGTTLGAPYWFSAPDSGYSVDDLPPAMPAPFTGQYGGGATALHWNRNTETDLAGYRLYRGSSAAFVPDPANLVATPPDTGYVDAAGGPYVYKLTAVDSHGNESPVATLVPGGVLDAPGGPLATFFLAPVAPNPAKLGAAATLRFGLSRSGAVRLEVIDAAGRRVRVLASGELAAGEHRVRWDGRSEGGQRAAAGLYFVRLEAEGRRTERRLALIE